MMKSDQEKARLWPEEHWVLTKCVCVCVAILGLVLTHLGIMTARTAFAASLFTVIYVVLVTRHCTRRRKEVDQGDRSR
jgi:Flp pilus assembly protein TadB